MTDKRIEKERILSALRDYVDLGLPIIPVCAHDHAGYSERHIATCNKAGKIPLIKGWQTHDNTTNEQVQSWIKQFKSINIGLPLGHVSGYVGIDVDGNLGEDLLEEMSNGDLPETWEYVTGDGRRLLYQIPVGMQTKKYVNTGEGDHQECSILASGQQTVLPPSIHHTGRIYEWLEGHSPEDSDCAMAPAWLLDLVVVTPRKNPGGLGIIDLTQPGAPEVKPQVVEVKPLVVSETLLPAEFSDYSMLDLDTTPPDTDYVGKTAKEQEKEDDNRVTQEELMQRLTAGSRDNQMTRIIGSFCAQFRALGKDYIMLMAKNHNIQFCDPPLEDSAIEAKVNHFWELEQMKSSQFKNNAGVAGDKKVFEPGTIAQVVVNRLEEDGYCLKADPATPTLWMTKKSEGPWQAYEVSGNAEAFQEFIAAPLGDPKLGGEGRWLTRKNFGEVANAIILALRMAQRYWNVSTQNVDTQTLESFKYIPLAGGKLLDWKKKELLPWDPETNLTYTLPIEYDPDAKCPEWEKRLAEWLPDEGSRLIMQEFIGYSFIPYMGFEKALMIQGEGANGKSLFLETIQGMLGYKVVDSINMQTLFSRFGQADLLGKILNIVNEAGSEYLRGHNADAFKNLVSGGRVKADIKNKSYLTFNNTAKFVFAANHDIKTSDKSEGWLRRMLIIPFDQDFSKSTTPKYEIMDALRKEYSGIFNWAIEGLKRLMENREFSTSESAARKLDDYVKRNDIAADFYLHCLERKVELGVNGKPIDRGLASTTVVQLFQLWVDYRESTVIKMKEKISEYLEKKGYKKKRASKPPLSNTSMTLCWINLGIRIRDEGFLEELANSLEADPLVKQYAIDRLAALDSLYKNPAGKPVTEIPNTQAN